MYVPLARDTTSMPPHERHKTEAFILRDRASVPGSPSLRTSLCTTCIATPVKHHGETKAGYIVRLDKIVLARNVYRQQTMWRFSHLLLLRNISSRGRGGGRGGSDVNRQPTGMFAVSARKNELSLSRQET